MKKLTTLLLVFVALCLMAFSGCVDVGNFSAKHGDTVIITVTDEVANGTTLLDYMEDINGGDVVKSYVIKDGMLTVINQMEAKGNTYWMLYTDDVEYSNEDWGTVEVDGVIYRSATLGAEELPVKEGCTYIWQAQTFSW